MYYYVVTIKNWNGTDYTWKTHKIFKTKPAAEAFDNAHRNQLTTQGWETEGVEKCMFEEFKEEKTE